MNSFTFLEMAVDFEVRRQVALYLANPHRHPTELISPGTYRWDGETRSVILMRKKENADDYRYFPEPDLPPIRLTQEFVDQIASTLPELPQDRFRRYTTDLGLTPYSASVLIHQKELSDYFEEALKLCSNPRSLCNWITIEFAGRFKDTGKNLVSSGILPSHVAKLVDLIDKRTVTGPIAKAIADEMTLSPGLDPEAIIAKNPDYLPVGNIDEIEPLVDQVLAANPQSILDFKAGKEKAFAFLVGQVMKLSRGKASPQLVNDLLRKKLQ
jgi:aspartyl-tRNA(Asn)/glutamyl-tRNA(Gln) amidotransferase subunit B